MKYATYGIIIVLGLSVIVLWWIGSNAIRDRTEEYIYINKKQTADTSYDTDQTLKGMDVNGNVRCRPGRMYMALKGITLCIPYEVPSEVSKGDPQ